MAVAKRLCTLPKKCSVRERAGTSPVFCAVSIKASKLICVSLVLWGVIYIIASREHRVFGIKIEKASC